MIQSRRLTLRWKAEQHPGLFASRKREPGGSVAVAIHASREPGKPEQHETLSPCDVLSLDRYAAMVGRAGNEGVI